MDTQEDLKNFKDPLMANLDRGKRKSVKPRVRSGKSTRSLSDSVLMAVAVLVLGTMALFGYLFYQYQQQITWLNDELASSKMHLDEVNEKLVVSDRQIEDLNEGLNTSQSQLKVQNRELTRYKGLYQGVKSEQEQQVRDLEALSVQKADHSEVTALKGETAKIKEQVSQTNSSLGKLEARTQEQGARIEKNSQGLSSVQESSQTNQKEIADLRKSLEREYYNFELQEDGGYMKVFNVSLSLDDTDVSKRQFNLYVLADGKVIRKKNHAINEPILFYVEGQKKPYEVVVTRVDRDFVVGYLSIPKS